MDLSRISRKWATVTLEATLADGDPATLSGVDFALLPYKGTPDDDTTWRAAASFAAGPPTEDGTPTWVATVLLAGPDAGLVAALTAPAGVSDLWGRVVDDQEVDVVMVDRVRVQ